ncbi:hypothetical protein BDV97DRAFT_386820 [Delphinella strobiligena]|nr:hypothetical protein BDV97DRAFT_386820 [Delphinella strobiligena]
MSNLISIICIAFLAACFLLQFLMGMLGWFYGYKETQLSPHILEELSHMSVPRQSYESRGPSFASERGVIGVARSAPWMRGPSRLGEGRGCRLVDFRVGLVDAETNLKSGEAGCLITQ